MEIEMEQLQGCRKLGELCPGDCFIRPSGHTLYMKVKSGHVLSNKIGCLSLRDGSICEERADLTVIPLSVKAVIKKDDC